GTDASLEGMLLEKGGEARKLMTMLKYRQLYKPAFSVSLHELDSSRRTLLSSMIRNGTKHMEDEICRLASVPEGSVLVDASQPEYLEGDAVPGKTAVPVMDDTVVPLTDISPIARAIQFHPRQEYVLLVACPADYRERVAAASGDMVGLPLHDTDRN
ncbi:MAG: hypothetical protein QXP70_05540, partial [Methanomassiliicoccales archaeon]